MQPKNRKIFPTKMSTHIIQRECEQDFEMQYINYLQEKDLLAIHKYYLNLYPIPESETYKFEGRSTPSLYIIPDSSG